jgi:hypothetical protein
MVWRGGRSVAYVGKCVGWWVNLGKVVEKWWECVKFVWIWVEW